MSKLNPSPDVSLPVDITTRRSAIFGVSGSGKSNTAFRIIEMLLEAGEQVVLIDPKGEGWGLQTSADGKRAGFDVIVFGEPRGDIPELRVEHAEQIADFVVDSGRSVVLSFLGFVSDQDERRFVTRFFERLYRRKSQQAAKTRMLVVLEEAHLFVPEQASGKAGEMVGAIKRIARQGRAAGMGLMVIDQRPQEVAKSIISQSEMLICHQLVHKLDRDALRDWVQAYDRDGKGEAFLESLASLKPGEAWFWSPAWLGIFTRTKVDRRHTYDSGATPDGSPAAAPNAKAKVDLDSLRSHLAKVVDEAKANDPRHLQAELARLRKELAARPTAPSEPRIVETIVEVPVLKNGQLDRTEKAAGRMEAAIDKLVAEAAELRRMIAPATAPRPVPVRAAPAAAVRPPRTAVPPGPANPPADGLTPRQQRFLDAAAALATLDAEVSRETVSAWVGVHPRGGSVGEELKALEDAGYINNDRGRITVTEAGHAAAGAVDPAQAIEQAKSGLSPRQRRFFDFICAVHPGGITREQIAAQCDPPIHHRGGSLGEDLGRLVGRGLVEASRGTYRARDFLFAGR